MSNTGMLNRLGVIGDVHCASETLERALDALEAMNVEAILCVGDLVDGPGDADATLGLLQTHGVQCVAGNHERWFLDGEQRSLESATLEVSRASRAFIESLPKGRRYATPNGNALLCHGVGEDDEAWLRPDTRGYALQDMPTLRELMLDEDVDFMIGGHTHQRMIRVFPGLTVINAGTIHRKDEQTFMVVDFGAMRAEFYSAAEGKTGELIEEL
ncbi:MAG: metallophosphoesterase family protein, partial [Deltaproteobacteria bacterium]|nr:metallophosphoesterase family protein [Deltaproteobacteria bacterium]